VCLQVVDMNSDYLVSSSHYPEKGTYVFRYAPGRADGLQQHTFIKDRWRELLFYVSAQAEGLYKRVDQVDEKLKTTAYFKDRPDRMVYRSVTWVVSSQLGRLPPRHVMSLYMYQLTNTVARKITLKFSSDPKLNPRNDVARVKFVMPVVYDAQPEKNVQPPDLIEVTYHLAKGSITAESRVFIPKTNGTRLNVVDEFAPEPTPDELSEQYEKLLLLWKQVATDIRHADRDLKTMLAELQQTYLKCLPLKDAVELARSESRKEKKQQHDQDNEPADKGRKERDYLAPYLPADVWIFIYVFIH